MDLSWKDAWRHELRDSHGRWTKSPGSGQADEFSARVEDRILKNRDAETDKVTKAALTRALHAFAGKGDDSLAVAALQSAANRQRKLGNADKADELEGLARSAREHPYSKMDTDAIGKQIVAYFDAETVILVRHHLNRASAAFDAGDYQGAIEQLQQAANIAKVTPGNHNGLKYLTLANQIRSSTAVKDASLKAISDMTQQAKDLVAGMIGGKSSFTGKVSLFSQEERSNDYFTLWGETDWFGNISFSDGTAQVIKDLADTKKPVTKPDQTMVPLHELIHTIGQTPDDALPYQKIPAVQTAEEGFTQLGTAMHAAEFFRKMGIGDRETELEATDARGLPVVNPKWARKVQAVAADMQKERVKLDTMAAQHDARWQQVAGHLGELIQRLKREPDNLNYISTDDQFSGALSEIQHLGDSELASWAMQMKQRVHDLQQEPEDKRLTLAEYAEQRADPARIANQTSWGSYEWQTKLAQNWVMDVAAAEGDSSRKHQIELADEINRHGDKLKFQRMAYQLVRAERLGSGSQGGDFPDPESGPLSFADRNLLTGVEKVLMENWVPSARPGDDPDEAAIRSHSGSAYDAAIAWLRDTGVID